MTWLFQSGTQAAQTGGQLATQTAASAPAAVASGAIGQTGITGGLSTPAYSSFPNASAALAEGAAHPVDSLVDFVKDAAKERMGGGGSGAQAPPVGKSVFHGMLSGSKHKSSGGQQQSLPPAQVRSPISMGEGKNINDILAEMFPR